MEHKNDLTEMVFILDKSGSMHGLEPDTIGGFNSMIQKQKDEEGKAVVTTVLFNEGTETLHFRQDLESIEDLTSKDYRVGGLTALQDAVGSTIKRIKSCQEEEGVEPARTVFVITTDGMENASRNYSFKKIKKMIEKQQDKHGWEFLFLGANMDAIKTASHYGIKQDNAVSYYSDSEGTALNYNVVGEALSSVRQGRKLNRSWKKKIEDNMKKRRK